MRRTTTLTISEPGRDKGKKFILTEMPADQAERWALRALLALTNAGASLPEGIGDKGMAGLAVLGIEALTKLRFEDVEPLLEEMWSCIRFQPPNSKIPPQEIYTGEMSQIEEVGTRIALRRALVELHLGFSLAAAPRTSEPQGSRASSA